MVVMATYGGNEGKEESLINNSNWFCDMREEDGNHCNSLMIRKTTSWNILQPLLGMWSKRFPKGADGFVK